MKIINICGLIVCMMMGVVSASYAGDTVLFDPDGPDGGGAAIAVDAFDVLPGNGLAIAAVPPVAGTDNRFVYAAEISKLVGATIGAIAVPVGPDGPYELTVTIDAIEGITNAIDFNASGFANALFFNVLEGKLKIYHDDFSGGTVNANDLTGNAGTGYDDGTLILEADIVNVGSSSTYSISPENEGVLIPLDQFDNPPNLATQALRGAGNATVVATVTYFDPGWFREPPTVISVKLDTTLKNPFDSVNPSALVLGVAPFYGANNVNGLSAGEAIEDFHFEADGNMSFTVEVEEQPLACRFTGGGVDTDGNWDHTLEDGSMIRNGNGKLPDGIDRYQFGGQTGANTGQQPQPKGEWTHHQQTGPSGNFTFHGGTASAPAGTEIVEIRCSDPGYCFPAREAPAKQLDFDGIGTFKAIGNGKNAPMWQVAEPNVTEEGTGNKAFDGTFHWFEVNIDDLGEPGRKNDGAPDGEICPSQGFGEKGDKLLADCDCPDFYRITIYNGVSADAVTKLADGSIDPNSLNRTDILYEVYGYVDGGNLQIHPPTGYDSK